MQVNGDAQGGKGYGVNILGNSSDVTGHEGERLKPLNLPLVDVTDVATTNDNALLSGVIGSNRNLTLKGTNRLDVPSGSYYLNDVSLAARAVLNITGQVTFYLTGDFTVRGKPTISVASNQASDFKIFMTGGVAEIEGDGDFYGLIYAPNTDIELDGTRDCYGAIVGKTLAIQGDVQGHYDEALEITEVELPRRTALAQ